jgi:hypothetical protein
LALALHDQDWQWVQNLSLQLIDDVDPGIRGAAAQALGNLARIHHTLDLDRVLPALNQLKLDVAVAGQAEDALSDIEMFIKLPPSA